jgi:hypothetical protein
MIVLIFVILLLASFLESVLDSPVKIVSREFEDIARLVDLFD